MVDAARAAIKRCSPETLSPKCDVGSAAIRSALAGPMVKVDNGTRVEMREGKTKKSEPLLLTENHSFFPNTPIHVAGPQMRLYFELIESTILISLSGSCPLTPRPC
jgi:hypothetical protein